MDVGCGEWELLGSIFYEVYRGCIILGSYEEWLIF